MKSHHFSWLSHHEFLMDFTSESPIFQDVEIPLKYPHEISHDTTIFVGQIPIATLNGPTVHHFR
jgi:hypothetical protein